MGTNSKLHCALLSACVCFAVQGAMAADVTVDAGAKLQRISGFGASSAWNSLTSSEETLLWDTVSGAGLSLHRLRIDETGLVSSASNQTQLKIAQDAVRKGVKVWASPWSPVKAWQTVIGKDNSGNDELGFNFSYATQWATLLANYAKDMIKAGVPLYAISAQNEPDGRNFNHFTADELVRWIRDYLGPAMENTGVKIIAPETVNWYSFPSYKDAILKDAKASAYVPIVATHEYGGSPKAYPDIAAAGKEFWQTEIYESLNVTDPGINSAINTAILMHEALVTAGVNAWHYWWIHGPTGTSLFPNGVSTPAKRLWAMGNYSRFVRPGFTRISATATPANGVRLSAYIDSAATKLVVVIINGNASDVPLNFTLSGISPASMTAYITDTTQDLKAQATVSISSGKVSYTSPKRSIASLVFNLAEPVQEPYCEMSIPGKIEAENYDKGGSGVAYYDADSENKGGAYRTDGVDIEGNATDGYAVGYTDAGEWLEYTVNAGTAGTFNWTARVSMGGDSASFHLTIDGKDSTKSVTVPGTGSWSAYETVSGGTVALTKGKHIIRLSIDNPYANFDWLEFSDRTTGIPQALSLNTDKVYEYQIFDIRGNLKKAIRTDDFRASWNKERRSLPQGTYVIKAGKRVFSLQN